MSVLGVRWKIDGVPAAYITPGVGNGRYRVVFERQAGAELEQIEGIHWERPEIELLAAGKEYGLPEGYGFEVVTITYDSHSRTYTVELKTASQYLGDVTGYQAQIAELEENLTAATAQLAELEAAYDDN